MKKIIVIISLIIVPWSSLFAQEVRACALEVDYVDPRLYIKDSAEVEKAIAHPPPQEEQYLLFGYYHEAKKNNAPDSLLNELAWTATAFYKKLTGSFNWTAEILGWQVEAILHELDEKKYLRIWRE